MLGFLETISDLIEDGVMAHDEKQAQQLWFLRKGVASAAMELGHVFKTNTAVSDIHAYYDVVREARALIEETAHFTTDEKALISTVGFGHMADGDIHINIGIAGRENEALAEKLCNFVDPLVMDFIKKHGGSVSGEHGVGQQKAKYLGYSKSP